MDITPEQRQQLHTQVDATFRRIASQFRGNNLAVAVAVAYAQSVTTLNGAQMNAQQSQELLYAINDQLAQNPAFATMSAQQKQDEYDRLIYQSMVISMLRDGAATNPEAGLQAQEMSRVMLRQFGSNDPAAAPPRNKVLLGVALSDVSPAIAAAAGFHTRDGAFVNQVAPGSAAEKAGIKPGDILVRVADRDIKTSHDVLDTLASMSPGQVTTMRIFRQGSESDVGVTF
jgi:PDZ domain